MTVEDFLDCTVSDQWDGSCAASFSIKYTCVKLHDIPEYCSEWLMRYFSLYVDEGSENRTTIDITYRVDRSLHSHLIDAVNTTLAFNSGTWFCFRASGKDRRCEYSGITLYNRDCGCLILIFPEDPTNLPVTLMRITRSLLIIANVIHGWTIYHASCVESKGHGIVISGGRFSGKSFTTLSLLNCGHFNFLTNDKLLIHEDVNGIVARGLPNKVGLRYGSVGYFQSLKDWLSKDLDSVYPNPTLSQVLTYLKKKKRSEWPSISEKVFLLPKELSDAFGTKITNNVPIGTWVFPEYDPSLNSCYLEQVHAQEARELFFKGYIGIEEVVEPWMNSLFCKDLSDYYDRFCRFTNRNLSKMRVFHLKQNDNSLVELPELIRKRIAI